MFGGAINMSDMALVTSGDYQRYFVVDGKRYHHLIDPDTLWPAAYFNGVTVLCPDSGMADCLTTGLFCMPLEEGQKLVETLDGVEAMWCTTGQAGHHLQRLGQPPEKVKTLQKTSHHAEIRTTARFFMLSIYALSRTGITPR